MRVVIDTNIWISFLISDRLRRLDALLYTDALKILFSESLLNELANTMQKAKLKKYFAANALDEMLENLGSYIDLVDVRSVVTVCRDPNDNFLLALSKDGKADYLVTGDKDLLELKKFGRAQIVTITKFLETVSR